MAIDQVIARKPAEEEAPPLPNPLQDIRHNKEYIVGEKLGEGGFARCYVVKNVANEKEVLCCKALWKLKLKREADRVRARSEVSIHRRLNHPNIAKYHNACEDDHFVYIFMELCKLGSLKDLLARRKTLTEPEVRFYTKQLLNGVEYLMTQRVIHRDLKLANVFIASDMTLRIGDFGLAGQLAAGEDRRTTKCGTPNYTAPEVIDDNGHSFGVDMWAIGVIMYTLLVGIPPFQVKGGLKLIYEKIRNVDLQFPPEKNISPSAISVVNRILKANPDERPSFQQVREHGFFSEFTPSTLPGSALYEKPVFSSQIINNAKRSIELDEKNLKSPAAKNVRVRLSDIDADGFRRPLHTPGIGTRQKMCRSLSPLHLASSIKKESNPASTPVADPAGAVGPASVQPPVDTALPSVKPTHRPSSSKLFELYLSTIEKVELLIEGNFSRELIDKEIGVPSLKMPNFISKWIDQGSGQGFAYEFADGTSGVLFKEHCTLSASADKEHYEFIRTSNSQLPENVYFPKFAVPNQLQHKFMVFNKFTNYMEAELEGSVNKSDPQCPLELHLLNPDPYIPPIDNHCELTKLSHPKLIFLTKFFTTNIANFFRLSNGTIQMNLKEGKGKYVFAEGGRSVLIINSPRSMRCYKLVDLLFKSHQLKSLNTPMTISLNKIVRHIEYFKTILALIVKNHQSKLPRANQNGA